MSIVATQPDYLPARMLNEFVYCPRLFYYEWVEGVFAHNRSPDATRWIVTIDAPLPGLDYHAFFGVIVKDSTREGGTEIIVSLP